MVCLCHIAMGHHAGFVPKASKEATLLGETQAMWSRGWQQDGSIQSGKAAALPTPPQTRGAWIDPTGFASPSSSSSPKPFLPYFL